MQFQTLLRRSAALMLVGALGYAVIPVTSAQSQEPGGGNGGGYGATTQSTTPAAPDSADKTVKDAKPEAKERPATSGSAVPRNPSNLRCSNPSNPDCW